MENINNVIAKNLTILRKDAKLTQLELAERFNYSDKSVSKWENGESLPSIEVLYELTQFYNITLDDLTNSNFSLSQRQPLEKENISIFQDRYFPAKLIITLLAVSVIWILATVIFVCCKIIYNTNISIVYLWAIPTSCIVLIVFNSIWGRPIWLFAVLSLLVWSTLACFHIQFVEYQMWIIYILGVPLQIAIVLWSALLKKPESKRDLKSKNDEKKKDKNKLSTKDISKIKPLKDKNSKLKAINTNEENQISD